MGARVAELLKPANDLTVRDLSRAPFDQATIVVGLEVVGVGFEGLIQDGARFCGPTEVGQADGSVVEVVSDQARCRGRLPRIRLAGHLLKDAADDRPNLCEGLETVVGRLLQGFVDDVSQFFRQPGTEFRGVRRRVLAVSSAQFREGRGQVVKGSAATDHLEEQDSEGVDVAHSGDRGELRIPGEPAPLLR